MTDNKRFDLFAQKVTQTQVEQQGLGGKGLLTVPDRVVYKTNSPASDRRDRSMVEDGAAFQIYRNRIAVQIEGPQHIFNRAGSPSFTKPDALFKTPHVPVWNTADAQHEATMAITLSERAQHFMEKSPRRSLDGDIEIPWSPFVSSLAISGYGVADGPGKRIDPGATLQELLKQLRSRIGIEGGENRISYPSHPKLRHLKFKYSTSGPIVQ